MLLLLTLYFLLGAGIASAILLWIALYRLGWLKGLSDKGAGELSLYQRRLRHLARGHWYELAARCGWIVIISLLGWPWLLLAIFVKGE